MSLYDYFRSRAVTCDVHNKLTEKIIIGQASRSEADWKFNNTVKCLFPPNTACVVGDMITANGSNFFITAMYRSADSTIEGKMIRSNASIDIYRPTEVYNEAGTLTGHTDIAIVTNEPTIYEAVTGKMQQYDAGLLSTTIAKFYLPFPGVYVDSFVSFTTITGQVVELLDRIKLNNVNYCIDAINTASTPGMVLLQCSQDKRK